MKPLGVFRAVIVAATLVGVFSVLIAFSLAEEEPLKLPAATGAGRVVDALHGQDVPVQDSVASTSPINLKSLMPASGKDALEDGVVVGGNAYYRVHVKDSPESERGLYTVTTGPDHPAGDGLNVLYGNGSPETSHHTIRSYSSGIDYVQEMSATSTYRIVSLGSFAESLTPITGTQSMTTTGYRVTYVITNMDELIVVTEVNVNGEDESSSVEVTTIITNTDDEPVELGIRYLWDHQIDLDDGPTFQEVNPDNPIARTTEAEFMDPGFESYQIVDNDENPASPTFVVYGTVGGPATLVPTPTTPHLLQFACWRRAWNTAFSYDVTATRSIAVNSEDCAYDSGGDSAVLYFFGPDRDTAITIPPGGSYAVSASMLATEPPEYSISLAPLAAENDVGTRHALIATVVDESDDPVPGLPVCFSVSGANSAGGCLSTNNSGQVIFTYPGVTVGTDDISAWVDLNENGSQDAIEPSELASAEWQAIFLSIVGDGEGTSVQAVRTITATVVNSDTGNATQGAQVGLRVETRGTVSTTFSTTNASGQAVFTYTSRTGLTSIAPHNKAYAPSQRCEGVPIPVSSGYDLIVVWVDLDWDGNLGSGEPAIWCEAPTAITLASFTAEANNDGTVTLFWETVVEIDSAGFNLYRARDPNGPYVQINDQLIPSQGSGFGASYSFVDRPPGGGVYYYNLEDVGFDGSSTIHGPVTAELPATPDWHDWLYLPIILY